MDKENDKHLKEANKALNTPLDRLNNHEIGFSEYFIEKMKENVQGEEDKEEKKKENQNVK